MVITGRRAEALEKAAARLLEQTGAKVGAEVVPTAHGALERARQLAGPGGVVIATGSIYLVADLSSDPVTIGARRASIL